MIKAEVICDSISFQGNRLTTFQLRYPKFIHGEFMTHRVFSRNASSSRAIPTKKYLEEVRSDDLRATPISWGLNKPGMQASEICTREDEFYARERWRQAAIHAASIAEMMGHLHLHKQIVNRILEPFVHINVVCTATEYDNFFGLRLDKAAQPEMRQLAIEMYQAYSASEPVLLNPGEWHLPYCPDVYSKQCTMLDDAIKVSVARCARVSYLSHETGRESTIVEDLLLYQRLVGSQPLHASPAEHQATPDILGLTYSWDKPELHGNFVGWLQYRKMLKGESCAPLPEEFRNGRG